LTVYKHLTPGDQAESQPHRFALYLPARKKRKEKKRKGKNRTEQNRTEQNRTEQNRTEQNRTACQAKLQGQAVFCQPRHSASRLWTPRQGILDATQDNVLRLVIRCFEASKPLFDSTLIALVAAAVNFQLALDGWPAMHFLSAHIMLCRMFAAASCSFFSCFDTPSAQLKQLQVSASPITKLCMSSCK